MRLSFIDLATMDATLFTAIAGTLLGIGFGLTIPLVNHMTVEHSSYAQRGKNLAYLSVAIFLGQFLSSFVNVVGRVRSYSIFPRFRCGVRCGCRGYYQRDSGAGMRISAATTFNDHKNTGRACDAPAGIGLPKVIGNEKADGVSCHHTNCRRKRRGLRESCYQRAKQPLLC